MSVARAVIGQRSRRASNVLQLSARFGERFPGSPDPGFVEASGSAPPVVPGVLVSGVSGACLRWSLTAAFKAVAPPSVPDGSYTASRDLTLR